MRKESIFRKEFNFDPQQTSDVSYLESCLVVSITANFNAFKAVYKH